MLTWTEDNAVIAIRFTRFFAQQRQVGMVKLERDSLICVVITYSKILDEPGKVANPARGQLAEQGK